MGEEAASLLWERDVAARLAEFAAGDCSAAEEGKTSWLKREPWVCGDGERLCVLWSGGNEAVMWSCDGLPPLLVLGDLENGGDGGRWLKGKTMGRKIMAEREKERLKSVGEEEKILSKTKGEGGAGLFGFL